MFIGLCQKSWAKSWQFCRKKYRCLSEKNWLGKELKVWSILFVYRASLADVTVQAIFSLTSFLDLAQRSLYWHAVMDAVHDNSKIPFTFSSLSAWVMTVMTLSVLLFLPWIAPCRCQVALHLICQKKIFSSALKSSKRNHLRLVQWFPEQTSPHRLHVVSLPYSLTCYNLFDYFWFLFFSQFYMSWW